MILHYYAINGTLNGSMQKNLMDEVSGKVFHNDWNCGNETCTKLAKKITDLFPNEPYDLYYIPPKSISESQMHSKGLVPNKLRNSRKTIKDVFQKKQFKDNDDKLFQSAVNGNCIFFLSVIYYGKILCTHL